MFVDDAPPPPRPDPPRVLLAGDDGRTRARIGDALRRAGAEVVAEAADGLTAVSLAVDLRPDVALVDLLMPGGDGLTVARALHASAPDVRVLLLSVDPGPALQALALRAGALGALSRDRLDRLPALVARAAASRA